MTPIDDSSLVTPSGRLGCSSSKFLLHEDCKVYRVQEDSKDQQEGGETSMSPFEINYSLNLDLYTDTNNFAPNEYREVVNLSILVVYKVLKTQVIIIRQRNGKERSKW